MEKTYYEVKNKPNWFVIDDGLERVLVQLLEDSIAIVEINENSNLELINSDKLIFDKTMKNYNIQNLLDFIK